MATETALIRGRLHSGYSLSHTWCTCVYLLPLAVNTKWLNKVSGGVRLLKLHAWPGTFDWLRGRHGAKCQNVLQRKTTVSQLWKVNWDQLQIWCWENNFFFVFSVIFSHALEMAMSVSQWVGPPFWSRLKYLNDDEIKFFVFEFRYLCHTGNVSPCSPDLLYCATVRSKCSVYAIQAYDKIPAKLITFCQPTFLAVTKCQHAKILN